MSRKKHFTAILIALSAFLIVAIGVFLIGKSNTSPQSNPSSALPSDNIDFSAYKGLYYLNVCYDELPIGDALPDEYSNMHFNVYYRLALEFTEEGKADVMVYKRDVELAAQAAYEVILNSEKEELLNTYKTATSATESEINVYFLKQYGRLPTIP